MSRFLALAFLVFSSCLSCAGIKSPYIQVAQVDIMAKETVALVQYVDDDGDETTPEKGTRSTYCAGTWIDDKTVLTAFHCVRDLATDPIGAEVLLAAKDDPGYFKGTVTKTDPIDDLALVTSEKHPNHLYARLAKAAYIGEGVHILGHPAHKEWTYMHGYLSQVRTDVKSPGDHEQTIKVWQVSAPIWFGNSGGGAFDDSGNLVGVCSMLARGVPEVGYFVHLDLIKAFIRA